MRDSPFADPFTKVFQSPDLFERLASFESVRKHLADPGFLSQLQKLQALATDEHRDWGDLTSCAEVGRSIALASQKDPRIMQALMALQGHDLRVEETDLRRAESFGDMPRRAPLQLEQLMQTRDLSDPEEARLKGNERFKANDYAAALAHYEKGLEILRCRASSAAPEPAQIATLLSNAAQCLLNLKWPEKAKDAATEAIAIVRAQDQSKLIFDQAKLFYRRGLAFEQMGDFARALDDMDRALKQVQRREKSASNLTELQRLKAETARLQKLQASSLAEAEKKRHEQENERQAEVKRLQGAHLKKKEQVERIVPSQDYISEQDFSHFAYQRLTELIPSIRHVSKASGCELQALELKPDSKVQASITTKRGQRALYYEMDLHVTWRGKAAPKLAPVGSEELQGLIRVYNIAHDTKFELGGDENTSYIYQLGWDRRLSGPWVDDLTTESAELFDLVAEQVAEVVRELRKK